MVGKKKKRKQRKAKKQETCERKERVIVRERKNAGDRDKTDSYIVICTDRRVCAHVYHRSVLAVGMQIS